MPTSNSPLTSTGRSVAAVMEQNGLKTKREAVDFALRRAVRRVASVDELLALEGIGFDLDLDEIRNEDLTWVDEPEETPKQTKG